ncbi:MAG: hypothetical protein WCH93_07200 [Actinomycetota bacterium]
MSRVARVGLMSGAVVTAIVVSGALPAAAVASTTSVVSAAPNGANADSGSYDSSVSADGRYVAFESDASNLVAGDTNGVSDVFVRDMSTGTVVRVSVDSAEAEGDATSYDPSISADGRYVAFWSNATNLVASDTNGFSDVFVRDRTLDTTVRVSVDSAESQGDLRSSYPSISADGRYVAFWSTATNLVAVDTNGFSDVFVRDLTDGTTVLVSVNSLGVQGNFGSYEPSISADGRYVAFWSPATNLVAVDTNGFSDVFVRDLTDGTTVLVSVNSLGVQGNFGSFDPSISADGRYVAFDSAATNLTTVTDPPVSSCDADGPTYADDTLCFFDVFLAGSPAELPPTGGNPAGVVLVAVVLLGAGTCVLGLRRARTA